MLRLNRIILYYPFRIVGENISDASLRIHGDKTGDTCSLGAQQAVSSA